MVEVIKCPHTGMATILIELAAGKFKIDILGDELAQAVDLSRKSEHESLKKFLLGFNQQFSVGIESVGIEAIAQALVNSEDKK